MRLLGIEAVQTALTVPFGNHRCEEVSQIEPVDDFYDAGDRRIQGYLWVPKASSEDVEKPALKGIVLFAHGYNHFMDNFYGQFGAQLNSLGFFAAGIDWRGHGDSEGTRCHVDDFDDLPTSLLRFADTVVVPRVQKLLGKETSQEVLEEIPAFIYGESMGGAVALRADMLRPNYFRGLVLSAPLCGIDPELVPPDFVISMGQCISKVAPTAPIVPGEDHTDKCFKDPIKLEAVKRSNARYQGRMRLRMGMELTRICELIQSEIPNISCPLCILHSPNDKVTQPNESRNIFDGCSSEDKTYIEYENAYHVLFWEPADTRRQLGEDIIGWLIARSETSKEHLKGSAFIHRKEGTGELTDHSVFLLN